MTKRIASVVLALALGTWCTSAHALTAELAKKCRIMAIKAHPTQLAGTRSNYALEQRAYFADCISKNGHM